MPKKIVTKSRKKYNKSSNSTHNSPKKYSLYIALFDDEPKLGLFRGTTLHYKIGYFETGNHSSEIRGLRSMKCSSETLQILCIRKPI